MMNYQKVKMSITNKVLARFEPVKFDEELINQVIDVSNLAYPSNA